jgi:hypothetical protein
LQQQVLVLVVLLALEQKQLAQQQLVELGELQPVRQVRNLLHHR